MDLRTALSTLPAVDFLAIVEQIRAHPDSSLHRHLNGGWSLHQENTARLLDALNHQAEQEWAAATTNPDDPEVRRARAEAKRAGLKPPKEPPIRPIALRPENIHEALYLSYLDRITPSLPSRKRQQLSSDEFDKALGL